MKVGMLPGMKTSIANFMDITSRKRAEAALVESERRLSTCWAISREWRIAAGRMPSEPWSLSAKGARD